MTSEELEALPPGTRLYVPTETDVEVWEFGGKVYNRSWYTLLHPPDQSGQIINRRPVYTAPIDLLHATLNEAAAWEYVNSQLAERIEWITTKKLKP